MESNLFGFTPEKPRTNYFHLDIIPIWVLQQQSLGFASGKKEFIYVFSAWCFYWLMCRMEISVISTAAVCGRTKCEAISRRDAHGLCYQLLAAPVQTQLCHYECYQCQMDQNAFQAGFVLCIYIFLIERAWQWAAPSHNTLESPHWHTFLLHNFFSWCRISLNADTKLMLGSQVARNLVFAIQLFSQVPSCIKC